ncbi:hypothetical protein BDR06DRAFT_1008790 [Suillus hirtellus]|nr:hypothetical protein BDR06DRAFT_1008790 [Suillus hirtellus]
MDLPVFTVEDYGCMLKFLGYKSQSDASSTTDSSSTTYSTSSLKIMTQCMSPSSQTDTVVSVRLEGLINMLQGLCLEDRMAISVALLAHSDPDTSKGPAPAASTTDISVPVPTTKAPSVPSAAPNVAPGWVYGSVTLLADSDDKKDSTDDEDASNAASSLADASHIHCYHSKYFNMPINDKAPLYYIMRGRYIGVLSGWDATGPKVLSVSPAIFHKVDTVEQGIMIVKHAIERGEAVQVV